MGFRLSANRGLALDSSPPFAAGPLAGCTEAPPPFERPDAVKLGVFTFSRPFGAMKNW
jgi:hypothetical protein